MGKTIIRTDRAPAKPGVFSQAIKVAGFVYVTGQAAGTPETVRMVQGRIEEKMVPGGIREQTRQVLENVKAILEAAGCGLKDVVKAVIFLKDIRDFDAMNEVFKSYFPEPPARSTLEAKLASPDILVEIEVIAYTGS